MSDQEYLPAETESRELTQPAQPAGQSAIQSTVFEQAMMTEIKVAAQLAMMRPRNIMTVRDNILRTCSRPEFAEAAIWSKPVGGKTLAGPSIRLAEQLAREMGNIKIQKLMIEDTDERRTIKIIGWDLESSMSYSEDIIIKKVVERRQAKGRDVVYERQNTHGDTVFGVTATDDELLNAENARSSKVIRNIILRLVPEDLISEARQRCEQTMKNKAAADPQGELKKITDGFSAVGVRPSDLTTYLGHPLEQVQPAEIVDLRQVYASLRDGETTWAAVMEQRAFAQGKGGSVATLDTGRQRPTLKPVEEGSETAQSAASEPEEAETEEGAGDGGMLPEIDPTWPKVKKSDLKGIFEDADNMLGEKCRWLGPQDQFAHVWLVASVVDAWGLESDRDIPKRLRGKFVAAMKAILGQILENVVPRGE